MHQAEREISKLLPEFRKMHTLGGALTYEIGEDAVENVKKRDMLDKFAAATNPRSLHTALEDYPRVVKETPLIERSVDPYWVAKIIDEFPNARQRLEEVINHHDPMGIYRAVTGELLNLDDAITARNPLHAGLALASYPQARKHRSAILRSEKPEELARALVNYRMGRYAHLLAKASDPEWVASVLSDPRVPQIYKRMVLKSLKSRTPARVHLAARPEKVFAHNAIDVLRGAGLRIIRSRSGEHVLIPVKLYDANDLRGRSIEIESDPPITFKGVGYRGLVPFNKGLKSGKISAEEAITSAENAILVNKWFESAFERLAKVFPDAFKDYRHPAATIIPLGIFRLRQMIVPDERKIWKVLATIPPAPLPKLPPPAKLRVLDAIARQSAEDWAREFRDTHPLAYTLPVGDNTRVMEVLMGVRRPREIRDAKRHMKIFGARLGAVEGMLLARNFALTDPEASSFAPHNVTIHGVPVDIEAPNEKPSDTDRFKEIANALQTIRYLAMAMRTSPLHGYAAFKKGIIAGYESAR